MPLYLNTLGRSRLAVAICDRCRKKFPIDALGPDPNVPGLRVCAADRDQYDPHRLAPRRADKIALPFVRKGESVATNPEGVITEDGDAFLITEDGDGFLVFDGGSV